MLDIAGAGAALAFPAVLGRAVDRVVVASRTDSSDWSTARGAVLGAAGLIAFQVAVGAVGQLMTDSGAARSTGDLRRTVVRHVLAGDPALTQRIPAGDLVTRLVSSTTTAAKAVAVVAGLAGALIPPIGGLVALALIDPWLAVTFGVGMISVSGAVRRYLRDAGAATAGYLAAQGRMAARLVDALAGARSIAAARTTEREVERVLEPLGALRRHGLTTWQNMARLAFQGEPVVLLSQLAVVAVAGLALSAGRLSPGEMLAASRYAVMAAGIGGIINQLSALTRARAAAQRLAEVLDAPLARYGRRTLPAGPGRLELVGVRAGPASAPLLDGLELVVPGGRTMALVGRSGVGKSLTAALAGRLCDPAEGQVLIDGVPLHELDRRALRRAVAYAFERPALLGGTVAGAIGLGLDRPSRDQVRTAARAARADGFIGRLPDGYDAPLTDTPLSGGELQRIGLARALARECRVLILDDATSSLDTATEAEIALALTDHTTSCTRLIVTHRVATAARADLVAWLHDGRVRAVGPHHELWADPDYRAIFGVDPVGAPQPSRARRTETLVAAVSSSPAGSRR